MKSLRLNPNGLYKKIEYQLKAVNLSIEIILGLKRRKIYWLLKKANRICERFAFSKDELKQLSILIAGGNLKKPKKIIEIAKLFFKNICKIKNRIINNLILFITNNFILELFFDKKQIIRC